MPKRYAIIDKEGKVINAIIWDGVTPIGNSFMDAKGQVISAEDVILVEEPYASPNDVIIDQKVYRLACPEVHTVDVTKSKKITSSGEIKAPKVEDLAPIFSKITVPEKTELETVLEEKQIIDEIQSFVDKGEGDAV